MKKTLLLGLAVAACFGVANAETPTPTIYPNASFQQISKDGRYIISYINDVMTVYDLVEESAVEYGDGWDVIYSPGLGNCMTADGSVILASTKNDFEAVYLKNGEWFQFSVPDPEKTNLAQGITPDGSRACGSVGTADISIDQENIMQVPVYWDRNEDGTFGEWHALPYPDKDFFGDTPQYITAIVISDDGKTIVGQLVFGNGGMHVPVVYTENEKGEWSYALPTKDLFNPDKLEPVEDPGDGPTGPDYMDYLTQEEYDAWQEAFQFWIPGETEYPSIENYMSAENRAAYQAATEAYEKEVAAWSVKYDKYEEYITAVISSSPNFLFNTVLLSLDGKTVIGALEEDDPNADPWAWGASSIYVPCEVNIATNELTKISVPETCIPTYVADGGVIFGYNTQRSTPMRGYIIQNGVATDIQDYIASVNPAYGEWIKENMTHEVGVGYDENTWEEIYEELTFTGMPISTPDMSKIAIWNTAPWAWDMDAEGVIFDFTKTPTGIGNITAEKGNIKFVNGTLQVPAGFVSVDIYNLSGACVKTVTKPAGAVKLNLSNGAYIAKGTRADGSVSVLKIAK